MSNRTLSEDLTVVPAAAAPDHPRVSFGRIGVLLVNLGTPDGTDYWSMRRYLAEFLTDRRVIECRRCIGIQSYSASS